MTSGSNVLVSQVSMSLTNIAVGSLPDSQIYDIVKMERALDWSSSAFLSKFLNEQVLVPLHVGPSTIRPTHTDNKPTTTNFEVEDPENQYDTAKALCAHGIPAACFAASSSTPLHFVVWLRGESQLHPLQLLFTL